MFAYTYEAHRDMGISFKVLNILRPESVLIETPALCMTTKSRCFVFLPLATVSAVYELAVDLSCSLTNPCNQISDASTIASVTRVINPVAS